MNSIDKRLLIGLRYLCLVCVITIGLISIIASGGGGGDEGGNSSGSTSDNGSVNGEDNEYESLDLSEIGASWTEDMSAAVAADTDGNAMVVQNDSIVWVTPDGEDIVVYYDENNLPTKTVIEDSIILYENWTINTVDIAIISPEGIYTIYRNLTIDADLISDLTSIASVSNISENNLFAKIKLHSVAYAFETDNLASMLQIGGKIISAAWCAVNIVGAIESMGVTFPMLAQACASTALSIISAITNEDNALLGATGDTLTIISSISCDNPLTCAGAWMSNAGRIIEIADANIGEQSLIITEAESKLLDNSDISPPMTPTGLVASAISSSEIELSWDIPYDNVGVLGYRIYRDGLYLLTTSGNSTIDIGLSPETQYCYSIYALDAAVNVSEQSDEVCATTLAGGSITTYPNTVKNSISVGEGPWDLVVTPNGNYVYITNYLDNSVSVIQTSDNTVINTISVGNAPKGIEVTPDGSYIYVANSIDSTVSVISTLNNTILKTINLEEPAAYISITPDGSYAYIAPGTADGDFSVIQISDNTVIKTILFNDWSTGITVTPNGNHVYATKWDPLGRVYVIQTSDNTISDIISVEGYPTGIDVTSDGNYVYVVTTGNNSVSVIQTSDNNVIESISVGYYPENLTISSDGSHIYVTNRDDKSLSVIQKSTNTIVETISVNNNPTNVAITPDGSRVYVTVSDGTVVVLE